MSGPERLGLALADRRETLRGKLDRETQLGIEESVRMPS